MVITNGMNGGNWTKTDKFATHYLFFEPNGTFKKSISWNSRVFRGYFTVNGPGKVICTYPDGVTLDITIIDEDKFKLNNEIYTLVSGYKGPKY